MKNSIHIINQDCFSCGFFDELFLTAGTFVEQVYMVIGPQMIGVMRAIAIGYILVTGLRVILAADHSLIKKAPIVLLMTVIAAAMAGDYSIYNDWIQKPLQDTALGLGDLILKIAAYNNPTLATMPPLEAYGSGYSRLIHMVEVMVWGVFRFSGDLISAGGTGVPNPAKAIAAILLLLPYMFVFALFSAFMVEAMFKFVAIGMAAPLLIAGIPFQFTRTFATTGFRILLGATLTIFFAAGAMGFTMSTVHSRVQILTQQYGFAAQIEAEESAKIICAKETQDFFKRTGDDMPGVSDLPRCSMATVRANILREQVAKFSLFSSEFFVIFIIGFVSILLHLQAKSLASNLSGTNDGPGAAAAVVGGGQALLGAGFLASKRIIFGQKGASGFARQLGGMIPGGQSLADGGAAGGVATGAKNIVNAFSGNGPKTAEGSGWNDAVSGSSGFKGGGMSLDDKTMKKLGETIGASVGAAVTQSMNAARNREG